MKNIVEVELDRRQKEVRNFNARMQRLFGFVKNLHAEVKAQRQLFNLPGFEVNGMPKEYVAKAEQEKANAVMFVQRRQLCAQ